MAVFISRFKKFGINDGERSIRFSNQGISGVYQTEDEEEIAWLESQPNFGNDFVRTDKVPTVAESRVVKGVYTVNGEQDTAKLKDELIEEMKPKIKRLLELALRNLKMDGDTRSSADEEELDELNSLRDEFGITE